MSCNPSCTAASRYYVGDIGTEVLVEVCSDISTATVAELKVRKPDGTEVTWVGSVYETTKIRYVVQSGDFDQEGTYRVQAHVVMPGWSGYGDTASFKVTARFE